RPRPRRLAARAESGPPRKARRALWLARDRDRRVRARVSLRPVAGASGLHRHRGNACPGGRRERHAAIRPRGTRVARADHAHGGNASGPDEGIHGGGARSASDLSGAPVRAQYPRRGRRYGARRLLPDRTGRDSPIAVRDGRAQPHPRARGTRAGVARRSPARPPPVADAALAQGITGAGAALLLAFFGALPLYVIRVFQHPGFGATERLGLLGLAVGAVVLIPAVGMGLSFPLLADLAAPRDAARGADVGAAYALNTLGSIAGAVLTGFVLVVTLGTETTLRLGLVINGVA